MTGLVMTVLIVLGLIVYIGIALVISAYCMYRYKAACDQQLIDYKKKMGRWTVTDEFCHGAWGELAAWTWIWPIEVVFVGCQILAVAVIVRISKWFEDFSNRRLQRDHRKMVEQRDKEIRERAGREEALLQETIKPVQDSFSYRQEIKR